MRLANPLLFFGDKNHLVVNTSDGTRGIEGASVVVRNKVTGNVLASGVTNQAGATRFPLTQFNSLNDLEIMVSHSAYNRMRLDVNPNAGLQSYFVQLVPARRQPPKGNLVNVLTVNNQDTEDGKFRIRNLKTGYYLAGAAVLGLLVYAFTMKNKNA